MSSVTENGVADVTITFREVYQATPAAVVGAGVATNLNGLINAISASSIRVLTVNSSNAATVGRKSSVICAGLI